MKFYFGENETRVVGTLGISSDNSAAVPYLDALLQVAAPKERNMSKSSRVNYDYPSESPEKSPHWERIVGEDTGGAAGGTTSMIINSHEELIAAFKQDVTCLQQIGNSNRKEVYLKVAVWSCIIGYCEAITTHKVSSRRYSIFPIPMSSLIRLVQEEFLPLIKQVSSNTNDSMIEPTNDDNDHRETVRSLSNAIWKRCQNKSSSMQDELHANSLFVLLCGEVDGKSLDCFGSALSTVIGMNLLGYTSILTLSEDHAYESHKTTTHNTSSSNKIYATCEVAVPGNTKASQSKRGREISETFIDLQKQSPRQDSRKNITAETSWLYMQGNAVLCDNPCMVLAGIVGNMNCDIDKQKHVGVSNKPVLVSGALYKLKRDLLWQLYDAKCMDNFPFALMELGECEEHLSSERGMEWTDATTLLSNGEINDEESGKGKTMVLRNEYLFLLAISISKKNYRDAQVYPYLYAAHYHRDAGREDQSQEYRLVESIRLYSEASRVACQYRFDAKDCLQLMKHMTTVSSLIAKDILLSPNNVGSDGKVARTWQQQDNAIAAATWLLGFFDSLLLWEETEESQFVEVLNIQHRHSLGKMFQLFSPDIRVAAIRMIYSGRKDQHTQRNANTEDELIYFKAPKSNRFSKDSFLLQALVKKKIVIRELEIALPLSNSEERSSRQRKRLKTE